MAFVKIRYTHARRHGKFSSKCDHFDVRKTAFSHFCHTVMAFKRSYRRIGILLYLRDTHTILTFRWC